LDFTLRNILNKFNVMYIYQSCMNKKFKKMGKISALKKIMSSFITHYLHILFYLNNHCN